MATTVVPLWAPRWSFCDVKTPAAEARGIPGIFGCGHGRRALQSAVVSRPPWRVPNRFTSGRARTDDRSQAPGVRIEEGEAMFASWNLREIVLVAVLAVVFGILYLWWIPVGALAAGLGGPVAREPFFGFW